MTRAKVLQKGKKRLLLQTSKKITSMISSFVCNQYIESASFQRLDKIKAFTGQREQLKSLPLRNNPLVIKNG